MGTVNGLLISCRPSRPSSLAAPAFTAAQVQSWRSVAGVMLLALINNSFKILNVAPLYKDLTTGLINVSAVALSAAERRR